MHLTIAYITNRRECMVQWFFDSLRREIERYGQGLKIRTVMVDFYAAERHGQFGFDFHVPPKPTVWQGPHRLTTRDYFAMSSARNTSLCLAPDGWLLCVDDLSVLMPGYLKAVRLSMEGGYIACGAYRKVDDLKVASGVAVSYVENPTGVDSRWRLGNDYVPVTISGGQMFGCSTCCPVEALLQINGWDEDCDSMGSEDYICGLMLERAGWALKYDRRMLTLESEELHHKEISMLRIIKMHPVDASHSILNLVLSGRRRTGACYYPEELREVRKQVLAGKPFPIPTEPIKDWRDGQLLSEM